MAKIKRSTGEIIFEYFNMALMIFIVIITLYPMLYVAFASFSDSAQLLQHRGLLLKPLGFNLNAYKLVFKNPMIVKGYRNTLFIVVVGVAINVFMSSLGAYFLSRKNVMLKGPITFFIVFTMFFSGGMVPFYLTVKDLGITNTLWSAIIPFMISTYNMIIMRTAFSAIPDSLEESAKLDGAGHFTILTRIVLPLSKAVIAVMVLYYAVDKWNGWFWSSVFIRNRELYPLQVILREILLQNDTNAMTGGINAMDQEAVSESIKYATIMVATVPVLCIYPFVQKYFVKGVLIGSVKG